MKLAKAYDDMMQSLAAGWSRADALRHASECWGVSMSDLYTYAAQFEGGF